MQIDVQVVTHHDRKQSNDVSKRHDGWPNEGKVEFVDYCASYRPGNLPDVLRSINFVVQPRQKVGVVGRTGAGKSSLLLALLRILRSSRGRILIDGVDIAQVPLQKLRSAITIIPQASLTQLFSLFTWSSRSYNFFSDIFKPINVEIWGREVTAGFSSRT